MALIGFGRFLRSKEDFDMGIGFRSEGQFTLMTFFDGHTTHCMPANSVNYSTLV